MYEPKIDPNGSFARAAKLFLDDLGTAIGEVNVANGWDTSREMIKDPMLYDPRHLVAHEIAQLSLIATEVSEAIEEIRNGRSVTEVRYSGSNESPYDERDPFNSDGTPRKPEGVPSELADIIIRTLDIAAAYGVDIGTAVIEKLNHNATRGNRHGGKKL